MAYPILSLWLLVTRLGPHAYGQSAPAQENHTTPVDGPTSSLLLDNSHFAFSLYQQLVAPDPDRNVLFSPLSLSAPLTLLALQAKPKARPQILQDLGFHLTGVPESRLHEHPSQLLEALLSAPGACRMDTGSMLFLGQGRNPRRKFAQRARSLYRTEIHATSFKNYRVARHQMDLAMEKKTGGKIKTFFEGMKMHSVLILANYIFFKGKWKYRFDPKDTRIMPFSVSKELSVPVPMMQRLGWFQLQYFRHLHSHALQVPCVCNTTALFILPEKGTLAQVEEALMKDNLDKWTEPFPLNRRKLYFPKLSLTGNYDLDKLVLSPSGLDMFGYGIGLSGISVQTIPIKVSKAVHRVELTMDEEGTDKENVASFRYFPKHQIPAVHFNKPFLLLVYQEGSHNILFMGKVINPNAS
ncbi:alpha-1-antitrypsin [Ictidomys tridecemlineatus]|uniref:Alpha-1-antitrypsin n=1 Tax=Ictidomys tridecemlineatus TaxID=43179 RepID=I3MS09_ICTTR|nr:alpha-1-antitrypsin [Ictidomys tridecemlineatus]